MKKIILVICFICSLIGTISCNSVNARNNDSNRMESIIEDHGLYVYKFNVKDHSGITHEIVVCRTSMNNGGVSMIKINSY